MAIQTTQKRKIIKKMSYAEIETHFGTEPFLLSCGWIDERYNNIKITTNINTIKEANEKLILEKETIPDYTQSIFPYYITMLLSTHEIVEILCEKFLNSQLTQPEKKELSSSSILFYCSRNLAKSISEFPVVIEEYI